MSHIAALIAEVGMVLSTIAAVAGAAAYGAWRLFYYILDCRNPIGKTAAATIAALWLVCGLILSNI